MGLTREQCAERKAKEAERAKRMEAEKAIVATGKCPRCGRNIRPNSAIRGWYQCEQYGAEGFRKDSSQPSCDWQTIIS